jgi:hypothetical protein
MKGAGGGFDYCYNAQTAVDDTAHIIVAAELTNCAADSQQLPVVLAAVKANLDANPGQVLADAGYRSEDVLEQLSKHPADLIVALGREGKLELAIDPSTRPRCAAMAEKFKSPATQAAYRRRKWLAEPPNGWIKQILGFRQFSLRGLTKVKAEWRLVCAALNLRRMASFKAA